MDVQVHNEQSLGFICVPDAQTTTRPCFHANISFRKPQHGRVRWVGQQTCITDGHITVALPRQVVLESLNWYHTFTCPVSSERNQSNPQKAFTPCYRLLDSPTVQSKYTCGPTSLQNAAKVTLDSKCASKYTRSIPAIMISRPSAPMITSPSIAAVQLRKREKRAG